MRTLALILTILLTGCSTATDATEPTPPPSEFTLSGSNETVGPFHLAGPYTVEVTTYRDCFYGWHFRSEDGPGSTSFDMQGQDIRTTDVDDFTPGDYTLEAVTGDGCRWSMEWTPTG